MGSSPSKESGSSQMASGSVLKPALHWDVVFLPSALWVLWVSPDGHVLVCSVVSFTHLGIF